MMLEGLGDLLLGGAAADVEEVGRLAAVQLDDVHGRHRQARAVDHAADVAVELDVVEVVLDELDAAPLAAAARVNLRLDDAERRPELFVGLARRLSVGHDPALGHGDAKAPQHLFGLVFVDLHQ
jgi:hypothetical protein